MIHKPHQWQCPICRIPDDPGTSSQLPSWRRTLRARELILFNWTEHFNYRTLVSSIFQQLSLSSFVIITMGHSDRSPSTTALTPPAFPRKTGPGLVLSIFHL